MKLCIVSKLGTSHWNTSSGFAGIFNRFKFTPKSGSKALDASVYLKLSSLFVGSPKSSKSEIALALGHHFNDVIETTMLNVIWNGSYKTMMPKLKSKNFEGLELIRPLYLVEEKDIIRWIDNAGIVPMDEACPIVKVKKESQRLNIKNLIEDLKSLNPVIEKNIFKSAENVALHAVLGYDNNGEKTSFLDVYDEGE